jgi:hypothetical protein
VVGIGHITGLGAPPSCIRGIELERSSGARLGAHLHRRRGSRGRFTV